MTKNREQLINEDTETNPTFNSSVKMETMEGTPRLRDRGHHGSMYM